MSSSLLLQLPSDLLSSGPIGAYLGALPFSPSLARLTLTTKRLYTSRLAVGKRVAGRASRRALEVLDRRVVLVVVHTHERRPGGGGAIVDLRQNFLMNVTSTTDLAHVHGALDKRLRVSANAMTDCKRPRPCGQAVAQGYTSVRPTRICLARRDSGARLPASGSCEALVAAAAALGDGTPAVHVNLHLEADDAAIAHHHFEGRWEDEDDESEEEDDEGDFEEEPERGTPH